MSLFNVTYTRPHPPGYLLWFHPRFQQTHRFFTFQLGSSTITPSKTGRNLEVVIDDELNFSDHITKTARSFRFALYNIKKIRPFLSDHATLLLVQALVLSRLDYCNALLAGLPASSIKPLGKARQGKFIYIAHFIHSGNSKCFT